MLKHFFICFSLKKTAISLFLYFVIMWKNKVKVEESNIVKIKLIWHSTWVNVKYDWWIIEMKKDVPIEVSTEVYENFIKKLPKTYKIIKL